MTERAKAAYEAWKKSDDTARAAEAKLKAAWEQHETNGAEPPTPTLFAEVALARAVSNDRLNAVMQAMSPPTLKKVRLCSEGRP